MPRFKKSLEVVIHILHMIGPSIPGVSEGHSDTLMDWQACLSYGWSLKLIFPTSSVSLYQDRW